MNKIEELILDFVDAWGFKLSGKNIDEDMLVEEKNKNMTKDLKGIINSAVEEQKEKDAEVVRSRIIGAETNSVWEWDNDRVLENMAKEILEQ